MNESLIPYSSKNCRREPIVGLGSSAQRSRGYRHSPPIGAPNTLGKRIHGNSPFLLAISGNLVQTVARGMQLWLAVCELTRRACLAIKCALARTQVANAVAFDKPHAMFRTSLSLICHHLYFRLETSFQEHICRRFQLTPHLTYFNLARMCSPPASSHLSQHCAELLRRSIGIPTSGF